MDDQHFTHLLKLAGVTPADRHTSTVLSGRSRDATLLHKQEWRRFCDRDLKMALDPGSTDDLLELKLNGAAGVHDDVVLEKAKNAWIAQVQVGMWNGDHTRAARRSHLCAASPCRRSAA